MTQVFALHSAYGLATAAAAIDAPGCIPPRNAATPDCADAADVTRSGSTRTPAPTR